MKKSLAMLLGLLHVLTSFALPPDGSKDEDDVLREARTFHILFKSEKEATSAWAQLKDTPPGQLLRAFQNMARTRSKDPGSASRGGDLGVVKEGEMVKSFEHALFALPSNTLSSTVRSEFGWHLILATDFAGTSVRVLCEESLSGTIRRAAPAERAQLQRTATLPPPSGAGFVKGVLELLGPSWGAPMRDAEGDLVFLAVTQRANAKGTAEVTVHTELSRARYAPEACTRSVRVVFALDCRTRDVTGMTSTYFEGRAALGRRLDTFSHKEAYRAATDTPAGQVMDMACGLEQPATAG
jgi:hypothetical protein